ncbi:MAG: hypothetical protein F6K19_28410 [Cyanothece sp. SIO1E1]|nr:hypothetical protein [Cyanothece sp. SIO1E1]
MEASDKIAKGFNAGYLLQKFEPELAKILLPSLEGVESPFFEGFADGAKHCVIEQEIEKSDIFPGMDEDIDLDISDKDIEQDMDLGKDDFDIDI